MNRFSIFQHVGTTRRFVMKYGEAFPSDLNAVDWKHVGDVQEGLLSEEAKASIESRDRWDYNLDLMFDEKK